MSFPAWPDGRPRRIAILGSTGSIGTQALEVVDQVPDKLAVAVLTAQHNADLLIRQAQRYRPAAVVIGNEALYPQVRDALLGLPIQVLAGPQALCDVVVRDDVDIVLTALVGFAGLLPTVAAIRAGKPIALANKETMVVAGKIINGLCKAHNVSIIPVDSEHSAIYQCLVGEPAGGIRRLVLTASGGPFRGYTAAQLAQVTKAQALKHPNWSMGAKITIDSATMMNKGLEVIEARWLFDLPADQIDIVVHPQSILHSLVEFHDGSLKAQLGLPDMRLPIQYALCYPDRLPNTFPRFDFLAARALTFERLDTGVFRSVHLAYEALRQGGNRACVLNAANEAAVAAFLADRISFAGIYDALERAWAAVPQLPHPTLDDLLAADAEARRVALI